MDIPSLSSQSERTQNTSYSLVWHLLTSNVQFFFQDAFVSYLGDAVAIQSVSTQPEYRDDITQMIDQVKKVSNL